MRNIQIIPQTEGKGRTFDAVLLASVEADPLWSGGAANSDNFRPVWAMFAGSDSELRSFMANLTAGKKAHFPHKDHYYRRKEEQLELLKSAGYQTVWQKESEGMLATVFLPELFQIDPGMVDPEAIKFIVLPSKDWLGQQHVDPSLAVSHARRLGFVLSKEQLETLPALSYLFCAYLDRRTRCPLIADGRFFLQLLLACLKAGVASFSIPQHYHYRNEIFGVSSELQYRESDVESVGLIPGLAFRSSHDIFEPLLAEQVGLFFEITQGSNGTHR